MSGKRSKWIRKQVTQQAMEVVMAHYRRKFRKQVLFNVVPFSCTFRILKQNWSRFRNRSLKGGVGQWLAQ